MTTAELTRESPCAADSDDLQTYALTGDADAFARVVRAHVDQVYTFCRRELRRNSVLAEDATQATFIVLARKARDGQIGPGVVLSGWLFKAAKYCCANALRSESRRARHEQEAAAMRAADPIPTGPDDSTLDALHEALGRLRPADRQAVLLRYFDKQDTRQIAAALGVTEDAAKHRVSRALGKLREILLHRGIAGATAAAVPGWLDSAVLPAPPHVVQATTAATAAAAAGIAASAATAPSAIADGAIRLMHLAKLKLFGSVAAAVVAVTAGGVAVTQLPRDPGPPSARVGQAIQTAVAAPAAPEIATPAPASPNAAWAALPADVVGPFSTLRTIVESVVREDREQFLQAVVTTPETLDETTAVLDSEIAGARLHRVAAEAFGPSVNFNPMGMATRDVLGWQIEHPNPADVKLDGDHAVILMRLPPGLVDSIPEPSRRILASWEGAEIHFVRDGNAWRFDTYRTMVRLVRDPSGTIREARPGELGPTFRALTAAMHEVSDEVESGVLTSASELGPRFNAAVQKREGTFTPVNMVGSGPRGRIEKLVGGR